MFGLTNSNREEMPVDLPVQSESQKVLMKELKYHQVFELMGEMQIEIQHDDNQQTLVPDFTAQDIVHLIVQAVFGFYVSVSMQEMSTTAVFNAKDIYFTSFLALVEGLGTKDIEQPSNLDILLKSWNFKRVEVEGDGNCLFTSVAHSYQGELIMVTHQYSKFYCRLVYLKITLTILST